MQKLQSDKHNIIKGTDQNFDYIKNTQYLLDTFMSSGLIPTITKPTRITHTTATLIDNIYISTHNRTAVHSPILCVGMSDHLPIITCIDKEKRDNKKNMKIIHKRIITEEAKEKIKANLKDFNWNYLDNLNTNDAYNNFIDRLNSFINEAAPVKTIYIPAKYVIRDPWMTPGLILSSNTLNALFKRKIGKHKTDPQYVKYVDYRNTYERLKRTIKQNYYDDLFQQYKFNIRKSWGVLNTLIGRTNNKTSISNIFKIDNIVINDPQKISDEFCKFFTNIGMKFAKDTNI